VADGAVESLPVHPLACSSKRRLPSAPAGAADLAPRRRASPRRWGTLAVMEARDRERSGGAPRPGGPPPTPARGAGAALARLGLAAAAAFVTVNIWTGAPLLALGVGSQTAGPSGWCMTAVGVVVVVLIVLVLALTALLTRINARYDRLTGRTAERRVSPWMRSMRAERDDAARERQGTSPIERVVVWSVTAAVIVFNAWFFFLAGSPVGNG